VVGGEDPKTADMLHDLWMAPADGTAPFKQVVIQGGYQPERVISATWGFHDQRLWILDEKPTKKDDVDVRLVRVEPNLGVVEVVHVWHKEASHAHKKRKWLVADLKGQILLVSSDSKHHRVAQLEAAAFNPIVPVTVRLQHHQPGALSFAPLVDLAGYTFVTIKGQGVKVIREPAIQYQPATLADLAALL
jgi:hypothetical protein